MALLLPKQLMDSCDDRTRNIVNGYIRESQKLFHCHSNPYYIIPELINYICLSFYWIAFKFNKKHIHQDLKIINDIIVTRTTKFGGFGLCVIDQSISGRIYDRFQIELTFRGISKGAFAGFYKLEYIDNPIASGISWNLPPGSCHTPDSVGIFNHDYTLCACQDGIVFQTKCVSFESWRKITLEFDFIRSECYFYHNEEKMDVILPIDTCYIIPAIALPDDGSVVEISKYEFNMHDD